MARVTLTPVKRPLAKVHQAKVHPGNPALVRVAVNRVPVRTLVLAWAPAVLVPALVHRPEDPGIADVAAAARAGAADPAPVAHPAVKVGQERLNSKPITAVRSGLDVAPFSDPGRASTPAT